MTSDPPPDHAAVTFATAAAAVLHALESGSPRLFVDNLNILAQTFNLRAPGAEDQNAGLNVSFDLYGYLKPAAQAAAPVAGGVRAQ